MIISNDLSVEEVWIIYWVISLVTLLSTYHDLGFTESLQYFLPKYWISKEHDKFKTIIVINLIIQFFSSIIMWALLYFWSDFLANNYFHTSQAIITLKYFSFYFLIINFFLIINSFFTAFQDTFKSKFIEFLKYLVIISISIRYFQNWTWTLEIYSKARILWVLLSTIIWIILFIKYYWHTLIKGKVNFNKELVSKYAKYAIMIFITLNIHYIFINIDQQLIIYMLWAKQAWYYSNFLSLLQIPTALIFPLFAFLFPITTELVNKNQIDKLRIMMNILYKYFTTIIIFFWFLFLIFGKAIAVILYWEKFLISGQLLQLTWIFYFLAALVQINFSIMAWMWKTHERMKIISIALIMNIIFNIILIYYLWIEWSAIAVVISNLSITTLSYLHLKKEINQKFDFKFIWKNILYAGILTLIIYKFLYHYFILKDAYRFQNFKYIMIISIAYFVVLTILNYKEILKFKKQIVKIKIWE